MPVENGSADEETNKRRKLLLETLELDKDDDEDEDEDGKEVTDKDKNGEEADERCELALTVCRRGLTGVQ